ncbi:NADH-quinone oxidoreductase subunit L [Corallococcus praedator]|uniref:NADH-quinone oxidoreductase subunit L n=1 Tax=Corallococcus praedator TaxID=2316724 RepID=A0ABX9QBM2_9BACT|nr:MULTISPECIES: NADH-quinone oxidoreductase subunit L [Corallococcus]RKH11716.1 NADH-quinone oxidoreductase subunit L [Corallococcus sp. CA047B]RKH26706.1 NADH-quinone oxidoreductase subunit L [Corallococcus sp. CA031C]RKH95570.1 NADH-quinone oxidoreductase subunit L [Corallococcus praedator]
MDGIVEFFRTAPIPPEVFAPSLGLIILLPLLGAFVCGVFGKWLGRANVHLVACSAIAGAFVLSLMAFWATSDAAGGRVVSMPNAFGLERDVVRYAISYDYGTWFAAGDFRVNFGLLVDHLSGILLLVITGVGFLIHLYSTSYMEHDDGYWRFFAYLNLFVAAMLTLVMADNLVLLFVGWEGVGMASYLLIGFWYTDSAKAWAGRKAFVTNRIGDFAFLIATFLLILTVNAFSQQADPRDFNSAGSSRARYTQGLLEKGPVTFKGLEKMALALPEGTGGAVSLATPIEAGPLAGYTFGGVMTATMLLFLLGAAGKSAQLPLYVWLPDAMAGPTPVSALIHAATMVTAGVYLFCRMSSLLVLSPTAMATIAIVGALTSLLAALIAFAQDDIKKVLAYSTVSQLGIMFMGVGMGVFWAAALHLLTHACFKACLFLGAGSVMHGNGDETDIKKLGGLYKEMKWTHATFLVSTLAITGIIPLSGFFSKDAVFHGVHHNHLHDLHWVSGFVYAMGLLITACTAFYMSRVYLLTFTGKRSPEAKVAHAHESSWFMTLPLVVLAFLSIVTLVYALPLMPRTGGGMQPVFENFLSPVLRPAEAVARAAQTVALDNSTPAFLDYLTAWLVALSGGAAAAFLYLKYFPAQVGKPVPAFARAVRRTAHNKFYVDELYEFILIRPVKFVAFILFRVVDALVIDTVLVRGTAYVTEKVGLGLRRLQTGDAQAYAAIMALAILGGAVYALLQVLS